jgi:hypothetical protein
MSNWELFFALLGLALALIPLGLDTLKVPMPKLLGIALVVVGILCFAFGIAIPTYRWLGPPTYVYLLPGRGLGENSAKAPREFVPRRVFVIQQSGPGALNNVQVTLHDNHARDQTAADY